MKLNEEHFEEFKKAVEKYVEILNLKSWKIFFDFKKLDDAFAISGVNCQDRTVTMTLSNELEEDEGQHCGIDIDRTALHECLEVLLIPLRHVADAKRYDEYLFELESHSIIRVLEKVIK